MTASLYPRPRQKPNACTNRYNNKGSRRQTKIPWSNTWNADQTKRRRNLPHQPTFSDRPHHRSCPVNEECPIIKNTSCDRNHTHKRRGRGAKEGNLALSLSDRHDELPCQLFSTRTRFLGASVCTVLQCSETYPRAGRQTSDPLLASCSANRQPRDPLRTEAVPQYSHLRRRILRGGVEYELGGRTIVSILPHRIRHYLRKLPHHLGIQTSVGDHLVDNGKRVRGFFHRVARRHTAHWSPS